MERPSEPSDTPLLRAKLRSTWFYGVVLQYRAIRRRVMRRPDGEAFLLRRYVRLHGESPNLKTPRTFTEKLLWRMVAWNRGDMPARFQQLSDKYAVRTHVAMLVGEDCLVKLLWHGDHAEAIPFDQLPAQYVIKPTHASGQVLIIRGDVDRKEVIRTVSGWLATDYYWDGREGQYYRMPPRIVIEEYLVNEDGSPPLDYKFYCFNGTPELILVRNHLHDIAPIFDTTWNLLDLSNSYKENVARPWMPKPANLEEMLGLAAKLSQGFGFVRVDFYNVKERVYFGELTFTPAGGLIKFRPEWWDLKLGEQWDLSLDR
ncbi:MAG: ATP-grasp fold amidoligase family protein [Nitrospira sp.]